MKNFDESRKKRQKTKAQRTFVLCGEEFVMKKGVRPESLSGFDSIEDDTTLTGSMQIIDGIFLAMIEKGEGAEERYAAIRADDEDPLTIEDLREVVDWMTEEATGRPTGSPSGSTGGRKSTGTSSTDGSSSPVLTAA